MSEHAPPEIITLEEMQVIYNDYLAHENKDDNILDMINAIQNNNEVIIDDKPNHIRIISIKTTNLYLYIYANHLSILLENIEGEDNLIAHNNDYISNIENFKLPLSGNLDTFFHNLINVFTEQYNLCMKMFDKYQSQLLEQHPDDKILQFLSNNQYTPSIFSNNMYKLAKQIKHHDLIDIECYKGTGLFYVYLNPDFPQIDEDILQNMNGFESLSRFCVLPTLGDNGHFLPEPGFSLVIKHGLSYFENSEINGFQISHMRSFQIKSKRSGDMKTKTHSGPTYIESHVSFESDDIMDEMIIDGVHIIGYFYGETYI